MINKVNTSSNDDLHHCIICAMDNYAKQIFFLALLGLKDKLKYVLDNTKEKHI